MTLPSALSAVAGSILVVLLTFVVLQLLWLLWPRSLAAKISRIQRQIQRQWHPRTPHDCPQCVAWSPPLPADLVEVVPWKATRCLRGAKKRFSSEGVACPNIDCVYFGCTVESMAHAGHFPRHGLVRGGKHASTLHDLFFRRLRCAFLQLDELVANIRGDDQHTFVWTAVDAVTKIIPHVHVGRRFITDAYAFVHGLTRRLAPGHIPIFSSDGLRHYFSALTAHFGFWRDPAPGKRKPTWIVDPRLLFGMLYKIKVGRKLKDLYSRIRCGRRFVKSCVTGTRRITGWA